MTLSYQATKPNLHEAPINADSAKKIESLRKKKPRPGLNLESKERHEIDKFNLL